MSIFTGSAVAIVTPFKKDGSVDYDKFRDVIEYQIAGGTDCIVVCGTTGESSTLSHEEHLDCIRFCADVVTPYYNKATQKGLIAHYTAVANSVTLPIIMYNVPSRTGTNIQPETAVYLAKNVKNIVAIKEATGNLSQVARLVSLADGCLDVYSGNDDQVMPILSLGGKGVISVLANVAPKETHDMVQKYLDGDVVGAREIQIKAIPLCEALFCEVNPIPVKKAVELMGLCEGNLRMPLTELEPEHTEQLKKAMTGFGVKIQ